MFGNKMVNPWEKWMQVSFHWKAGSLSIVLNLKYLDKIVVWETISRIYQRWLTYIYTYWIAVSVARSYHHIGYIWFIEWKANALFIVFIQTWITEKRGYFNLWDIYDHNFDRCLIIHLININITYLSKKVYYIIC